MVCPECDSWFKVYYETYGPGLNYCPCCGHEFSEEEYEEMEDEED